MTSTRTDRPAALAVALATVLALTAAAPRTTAASPPTSPGPETTDLLCCGGLLTSPMVLHHATPAAAARYQPLLLQVVATTTCAASCAIPEFTVELEHEGNVDAVVHRTGSGSVAAASIEVPDRFVWRDHIRYRIHAAQAVCGTASCRTVHRSTGWRTVHVHEVCPQTRSSAAAASTGGHPEPDTSC